MNMTITNIYRDPTILHLVYTPPPPHPQNSSALRGRVRKIPSPGGEEVDHRASYPTLRISPVGPQEVGSICRHRAKALQSMQLELKPQTLLLLLPPPSKFPRSLGMPRLQRVTVVPWLPEKEPNVTELYVYRSKKTSRGTAVPQIPTFKAKPESWFLGFLKALRHPVPPSTTEQILRTQTGSKPSASPQGSSCACEPSAAVGVGVGGRKAAC
ncbi:hypothetical protein CCUS01_04393 [Colletotrichum cuscutae]|uniref:Uncharacterized protein n=1 Tax=Colletotrichum cuscutae TaxID=1209917 RepID=A0AAI9VDX4_9PEZI|nr:hypothetical protein CCUS01_04393 [Colletotrichum cuscutae]